MKNIRLLTLAVDLILFLSAGIIFTSCIEINGSGYSDLSESDRLHVKPCTSCPDSLYNDGNLYQVTAEQVKAFIQKEQQVLVYEYLPFCSGESGRSPLEIKKFCDEKNLKCLIIASVYDGIIPIPETYTFPMMVIDHTVYQTNNYQQYGDAFYQDLTGCDDESRQMMGMYHLFCEGKYVHSFDSLTDCCL